MIKYRIIREYGLYYPQKKFIFWWVATEEPNNGYHTEVEAFSAVQQHNKMFGKDSKKKDIVWSGEMS